MRKEATFGIVIILVLAAGVVGYLVIYYPHAGNPAVSNESQPENTPAPFVDVNAPATTEPTTATAPTTEESVAATGTSTTEPGPRMGVDNGAVAEPRRTPDAGMGAETTYIIKAGDSLWKIAQDQYHDGTKHDLILKANPGLNPGALKVGQKIVIPPLGGTGVSSSGSGDSARDSVSGEVTTSGAGAGETYTVAAGDTLWTIAKKHYHDAAKAALIEAVNPGIKGKALHVGQKLTLPPDTGSTTRPGGASRPAHDRTAPHKKAPVAAPSNRPDFG